MKKFEFIKPLATIEHKDEGYGKFVISPLERGYGLTLGNALRRVLLSSMPGVAIVAAEIEGVEHEFMTLPGMLEDITEIILNLKNIIFAIPEDILFKSAPNEPGELYELTIDAVGERVITAGDLEHSSEITIINPEQVIVTLEKNARFKARFFARKGIGYVGAEENKAFCRDKAGNQIISRIAIDSIYTPITKARYEVEKTRVDENVDYERLILEVWTNKGIQPSDAVSLASKFLIQHFEVISQLNELINEQDYMYEREEKVTNKKLEKKIEELDLSVRSYNSLKRAGIHTIGELTQKTEEEMMRIRNMGRKSLKEVIQKLHELGLDLRRSYDTDYNASDDLDEIPEESELSEDAED
ncbi:MAG: DNA-directed RNA polymerase subunit alpha [Bacilli bacterium]|jgi:DNA-directed RNA polymerase subunit alpha|nr:DNA-directed RNA polymerase subunit alpha [Bacillota bacterium]NLM31977.1 DNA-directed RNA polymerase subunit alpha [Acholeplasmataceae bacterium]HOA77948.1 DNA-directed RNA polymerase subunit alpha [Bacilli bacterium]HPZ26740.1 DNA-directed RNA polymerase subunit alpha [Bacilli bacterium]HQC89209.1 DNA-directed RNA polymerase subunit alpha [Bacilli bacterium]